MMWADGGVVIGLVGVEKWEKGNFLIIQEQ